MTPASSKEESSGEQKPKDATPPPKASVNAWNTDAFGGRR
jgi:hypothetical protein